MFIEALFLFLIVRIITFFPMRFYKKWVSRPVAIRNDYNEQVSTALKKNIRRMQKYFFPDATCLVKSIVIKKILSRRGISSTLCIGVKKEGEKMYAHSWVLLNDEPLINGFNIGEYTVLTTL